MLFDAFLFIHFFVILHSAEIDLNFKDKILEGENRYKELTRKISPYGECWKKAVSDLHEGCKHLTEEIQSRLALSFSNCFLEHSGSNTCPCNAAVPVSECLRNSSDRVFSTYTEFFTHTQSICHYLQHREWQEQTETTVLKLTENSEAVSKKLDESSKSQSRILDLQHLSILEQKRLITNGRTLNAELQLSRNYAKHVFEAFKSTTNEQRVLIFEVFDRIKLLQNLVLSEFTGVYTFVYYAIGGILIYLLTSMPQTSGARIWLFMLISGNVILERAVVSYSLDEEVLQLFPLNDDGPIYYRIWLCRKLACIIGSAILIYFYYRYKDYNLINNELLKEIQKQNSDLTKYILDIKFRESTSNQFKPELKNSEQVSAASLKELSPLVSEETKQSSLIIKDPEINGSYVIFKENKDASLIISKRVTAASAGSKRTPSSSRKTTKSSLEKMAPKQKTEKSESKTPKGNIITPSRKKNLNMSETEQAPGRRYNLRSRSNTPSQSPYGIMSPETFSNNFTEAIDIHLKNKAIITNEIRM